MCYCNQNKTIIPHGTVVNVKMRILAYGGCINDFVLKVSFLILDGPYEDTTITKYLKVTRNNKGLYKNSFIKHALNSKYGLSNYDYSIEANKLRMVTNLNDINNLYFKARIEVDFDKHGNEINVLRWALTPDHAGYSEPVQARLSEILINNFKYEHRHTNR